MFALERIQKIRQILYEQRSVDVNSLRELLGVSDVTIRRDLERLEKEGFLTRSYGGAVLNEESSSGQSPGACNALPLNTSGSEQAASIAVSMIENQEAIFLSHGEICLRIARGLKSFKNLTVVTNDIAVALELSDLEGIRVIVLGGELMSPGTATAGPFTMQIIRSIFVNKAFINVSGISFERGYSTYDYNESLLYQELFSNVNEIIVLATEEKFGKSDFAMIAPLTKAQAVIADSADDSYKKYFFENNIRLYTSFELD